MNRMPTQSKRLRAPIGALVIALLFVSTGSFLLGQRDASGTYREAYNRGHRTGEKLGRQDQSRGRSPDYLEKRPYQVANEGFRAHRHDADVYFVAYRRGFEDGYEEGFGLNQPKMLPPPAPPRVTRVGASAPKFSLDRPMIEVPAGTEIRVRLVDNLSSRRNARLDKFVAKIMVDVQVDGRTALSQETPLQGVISYLKRPGRIKGRSEMKLRFNEILLKDSPPLPLEATVISINDRPNLSKDDEGTLGGEGSKGSDSKKIGTGAAIGALIGVLSRGAKGGVIGAGAGAAIGLGGVLGSRGKDIELPSGTELLIRLERPARVPMNAAVETGTRATPASSTRTGKSK